MKAAELRQKSKKELQELLEGQKETLRQLRFDLASGKVKNVRQIRQLRKTIAQILTLCPVPLH
ncbi:MAG: 50S ribosomal protein L29 [Candidatus Wildermuthbacteria bacterium RIFCSPHIGHO2_02_FULL_47_12]|uniref:Large ribosomal subunit protein uL29 n=1 Tax=Candidatus Wildermuthbacteria bacterium RIFCSPHIGHO2_02_FULL_47_12 TaxID=1802451 RepID=A0A1G2R3Y4_9BACT|nr:MAG: 50S ribosomal protein L29 [Candidatus Wildermuthbacteria bacterium RIFCSPHIGHO2_02_FULL_47_12]